MTGPSPDLDALREKAEKATPGPWEHEEPCDWIIIRRDPPVTGDGRMELLRASYSLDAAYVAAASPDVILAVLALVEEQRKALERCRALVEEAHRRIDGKSVSSRRSFTPEQIIDALAGSPAENKEP